MHFPSLVSSSCNWSLQISQATPCLPLKPTGGLTIKTWGANDWKMVLHGNVSTLNRIWLSMMINHLISGHLIFRQIHIPFILIEPGWIRLKQTVEYRIHLRRSLTMSDPLLAQDWFPSRWFSGDWKHLKTLGVSQKHTANTPFQYYLWVSQMVNYLHPGKWRYAD